MKPVLTYQGLDVVCALKKILASQEHERFPVIVLWDDEPSSYNNLMRFVKIEGAIFSFVRFGVACNGNFILDEVYYLLTSLRCRQRNPDQRAHVISKIIRSRNHQFTFFHKQLPPDRSWSNFMADWIDVWAGVKWTLHLFASQRSAR